MCCCKTLAASPQSNPKNVQRLSLAPACTCVGLGCATQAPRDRQRFCTPELCLCQKRRHHTRLHQPSASQTRWSFWKICWWESSILLPGSNPFLKFNSDPCGHPGWFPSLCRIQKCIGSISYLRPDRNLCFLFYQLSWWKLGTVIVVSKHCWIFWL